MLTYVTIGSSRHARLRLFAYYVQRVVTSRLVRAIATRATVALLGARHGRALPSGAGSAALDKMRAQGHVRLGRLLSDAQCAEVVAWLRTREMVGARGDRRVFRLDALPPGARIADHPPADVVACPHILALANHPAVLDVATGYLGYRPTITQLGLRWSFPGAGIDVGVQGFHRDSEPGSIKMMVYLTDVDLGSGPHCYVPGTHRDRMPLRLHRYADADIERDHGGGDIVTGAAGTAFMIDTRGIHKGTPPLRQARLVLMVQYSLLPCLIYDYAPLPYAGPAQFDPYINRLMISAA
jgi:hypothetical protein